MRNLFLLSALSSLVLAQGVAFAQQSQESYSTEQRSMEQQQQKSVENVDLFFDTNSAELSEQADAELKQLANWAKCDTRNAIILEGSADRRGSVAHNQELSARRAAAVRQKLIEQGVPSQRIVVSVFGENGERRDTMAQERRVTARAAQSPVTPDELSG